MTFRSHDGSQQIGQYIGENDLLPPTFANTNVTEIGEGMMFTIIYTFLHANYVILLSKYNLFFHVLHMFLSNVVFHHELAKLSKNKQIQIKTNHVHNIIIAVHLTAFRIDS